MSGVEYRQNEMRIEKIIRTINIGKISLEEALELRLEADKLIVTNQKMLEDGSGKVVLISLRGKKIVEEELSL